MQQRCQRRAFAHQRSLCSLVLLMLALAITAMTTTFVTATDFDDLSYNAAAAGGAGTRGKAGGNGTGGGTGTGGNGSGSVRQFHLTLAGTSKTNSKLVHYALDWVTPSTTTASQLVYGTSADAMTTRVEAKATGLVDEAPGTAVMCWSAVLKNLAPGTTIYYALASDATSKPKSFTVPSIDSFTWAVFGDLGAPMHKAASGVSLPALKNALDVNKAFHGVLNIGDLGYELSGLSGKSFMEGLEPITSKVVMQTTVGNHEYQYGLTPDFAVQNYYRRFAGLTLGAGRLSGSNSNEFYSFDMGLIHFAVINTEVYGDEAFVAVQADGSTWKVDDAARTATAKAQADWLAYDLSRVQRTTTPYVIVCGHRPPFKTPGALSASANKFAKDIVPLMSKYQVDLYLAGHEHTYLHFEASTFGSYNVPPIIISGSAGNNEFIREETELNIKGFAYKTLLSKYGYGYLTATTTSLQWQWGSTAMDATHNPKPAMWSLEDEVTIPRRVSFAAVATADGKPVVPLAIDVAAAWTTNGTTDMTGGSGGRDGAGDAGSSSNSKSNATKPTDGSPAAAQSVATRATPAVSSLLVALVTLVAFFVR